LIPVWHGSAQFSNQDQGPGLDAALGRYGYGPIFAHQEEDERWEYYVLRDRNIVGSMQGKPRLWRWLLLFQSGNLPCVRRGPLERSEHRKSLTPSGGQAFLLA
jgi:hypothetical protein